MTVPEKQKMGAQAVAIIKEEAKTLGIIVVDAADQYPLGKEKLIDALTRMETAIGNLWELTGLKPPSEMTAEEYLRYLKFSGGKGGGND